MMLKYSTPLACLAWFVTAPALAGAVTNAPPHVTQGYDAFEQTIAAPCHEVFRLMEQPDLWIAQYGPLKPTNPESAYQVEHLRGTMEGQLRYERRIARIPDRKLVVAMTDGDYQAFAVQTLRPVTGGCRVGIEVLFGSPWTTETKNSADAVRFEESLHRLNMKLLSEMGLRLKVLAEKR
ncbi:hypothetical protein [Sphingomonas sp.]|uniref:hypothetical protein n=1 Tax=Sphingomonas sp. TaxID=28214 RepID=UPI003D6C92CD